MCDNIDLFNKYCAVILRELYREFPVPTMLQLEILASEVGIKPEQFNGEALDIFVGTISFLEEEGYIRHGSPVIGASVGPTYMDCRLTSKGLTALNRTPKDLDDSPSIGERIAGWTGELIKDTSREVVKGVVQAFLGS